MYATVTGLSILLYKQLQEPYECYVIVTVFTIKRPKGASENIL